MAQTINNKRHISIRMMNHKSECLHCFAVSIEHIHEIIDQIERPIENADKTMKPPHPK